MAARANGSDQQLEEGEAVALTCLLERIMSDALQEHDGKDSIGCRYITNQWFADDIGTLRGLIEKLSLTIF